MMLSPLSLPTLLLARDGIEFPTGKTRFASGATGERRSRKDNDDGMTVDRLSGSAWQSGSDLKKANPSGNPNPSVVETGRKHGNKGE